MHESSQDTLTRRQSTNRIYTVATEKLKGFKKSNLFVFEMVVIRGILFFTHGTEKNPLIILNKKLKNYMCLRKLILFHFIQSFSDHPV